MSRNIKASGSLQHIYMFLFALRFQEAFWVIFLRSRGFSYAAIGLMETVYHVAGFFAEIPTGIVADRIGRKHSLIFGRVAAIAASVLVLYSRSLPLLVIAFMVWSLGGAFHSGAYEALVYDGLLEKGEGQTFTRVWGRLNGTFLAGASLAGLAGGLVAEATALRVLYFMSIAVDLLALAALLFLREPRIHEHRQSSCLGHISESFRILKDNPRIAGYLFFSGALGACVTTGAFYGQSHMQSAGIPLALIGGVATVTNLVSIIPARGAHLVQNRLGSSRAMRFGWLCIAGLILAIGLSGFWGGRIGRAALMVALALTGIIYECVFPIVSDRINTMVPSGQRATVLSAGGMVFSICMIGLFPLFGLAGDAFGLGWGYIGMGAAAVMGGVGVWVIRRRRAAPIQQSGELGENAGGN